MMRIQLKKVLGAHWLQTPESLEPHPQRLHQPMQLALGCWDPHLQHSLRIFGFIMNIREFLTGRSPKDLAKKRLAPIISVSG